MGDGQAFRNFVRGISAEKTRRDYVANLGNFLRAAGMEGMYEEAASLGAERIDAMFEGFIDAMSARGCRGSSIRTAISGPELFFVMNDCTWHRDRIRKSIRRDGLLPGGRTPLSTDEVRRMLAAARSERASALVHFMASTGCRPGALVDPVLRVGGLVPMPGPQGRCYAVSVYSGSTEQYWAFLTPEASGAMDAYLGARRAGGEDVGPGSALFANARPGAARYGYLTTRNAEYVIRGLMERAGVERTKVGGPRYDKPVMYGFRKRFNTILKLEGSVNPNVAEKLMGHRRGLDGTYLRPTREECHAEFVKAVPRLTVGAGGGPPRQAPGGDGALWDLRGMVEDLRRQMARNDADYRRALGELGEMIARAPGSPAGRKTI